MKQTSLENRTQTIFAAARWKELEASKQGSTWATYLAGAKEARLEAAKNQANSEETPQMASFWARTVC